MDDDTRTALTLAKRELECCMHASHKGQVCFDGDDFHEALTAVDKALAALTATTNEAAPALPAEWPQPSQDDLITVAHITLEGVTLTLEINQLGDLVHLVGEEEQTYELRIAPMRRGDFEDLGEFDGF